MWITVRMSPLNYEPTVNPVATGGYAWVVFTSRRMYGNVATIPPYCSDPRGVDLVQNITTKKLWVPPSTSTARSEPIKPPCILSSRAGDSGRELARFWVLIRAKPTVDHACPVISAAVVTATQWRWQLDLFQHAEQPVFWRSGKVHDCRELLRFHESLHQRILHPAHCRITVGTHASRSASHQNTASEPSFI